MITTFLVIIYFTTADSWLMGNKIDQLTEMIYGLALSVYILESRIGIIKKNSKLAIIFITPYLFYLLRPAFVKSLIGLKN